MNLQPDQPPYPPAAPAAPTSNLALASLITGVLAWVLLPIVGAIAAIITGHMAQSEIRNSAGRLTGNGLAIAGLVLGYGQLFLIVVPLCMIVLLALLGPAIGNVFSGIVADI